MSPHFLLVSWEGCACAYGLHLLSCSAASFLFDLVPRQALVSLGTSPPSADSFPDHTSSTAGDETIAAEAEEGGLETRLSHSLQSAVQQAR